MSGGSGREWGLALCPVWASVCPHWIMGRGRAFPALVAGSLGDVRGIPSMPGKASGLGGYSDVGSSPDSFP